MTPTKVTLPVKSSPVKGSAGLDDTGPDEEFAPGIYLPPPVKGSAPWDWVIEPLEPDPGT